MALGMSAPAYTRLDVDERRRRLLDLFARHSLWFLDGAIADWLEHGDFDRRELRDLLLATLLGAVDAAQARPS